MMTDSNPLHPLRRITRKHALALQAVQEDTHIVEQRGLVDFRVQTVGLELLERSGQGFERGDVRAERVGREPAEAAPFFGIEVPAEI